MSQNALNNETYDAPFTVNRRTAGQVSAVNVYNLDNTNAASEANVTMQVALGSSADVYMQASIAGTSGFAWGVDNSDGDSLKETIGATATPSSATVSRKVFSTGEQIMPLQPAFYAFLSGSDLNVTGAGTTFLVGSGNPYTIIQQQGSGFATNGVFTAPVQGFYHFSAAIIIDNISAAMDSMNVLFVLNGVNNLFGVNQHPGNTRNSGNSLLMNISGEAFLSAGGTCQVAVSLTGGAGDTASIRGAAINDNASQFRGYLVC